SGTSIAGYDTIGATGISTEGEFLFDSFYYDDETGMLFYSCYDGSDVVTLYAIADYYNSETGEEWLEVYPLGQFAPYVWPVSGLYQYDSESMATDKLEAHFEKLSTNALEMVSSIEKVPVSLKKSLALSKKEAVVEEEPVAEDESSNDVSANDVSENDETPEVPAEDVSENDAAPVEETPAEEAPSEDAEEPVPDTSANDD
ncbi:MAG: hypothetical protein J5626_01990, partial [Lachnospiraceae bacterium]|nr:hypothetical protein [Lachnospiraceae bacterium]